ncbi:MAG TPA: NAD-dependent epimerase/dehydratase family protein [Coriobacteriia bacterium]
MRVLVTGGAGFIGSNLTFALVGAGHEVGVVDDLSTGRIENLHPAAWFRKLDILDGSFADVTAEFAPEAIVHLAAQPSVSASIKDPERNHAVNVEGTRRVARAALTARARRVVSASSAAVYGEPATLPLPETAPKSPANPYGDSKLAAELVLIEELGATDVDFGSFRFSNVYGPRQDAFGEGGVVAIFAERMTSRTRVTIDGDGRQTRDFIFVGDIVSAIADALGTGERLAVEGIDSPAYNISTGEEVSVLDLAGRMRAITGYAEEFAHGPARGGDVARSSLDPTKAREVFGWQAHTSLDAGLELTLAWFATRTS